ncbi:hypothetical protein [Paenibacillus sp. FSL H8-0332]|uniref:hypothetical protein n=1 Tax=Paenibacillus sp. FSL H8-0332 TaxID=2954742 RepID=UPI0030CEA6FB
MDKFTDKIPSTSDLAGIKTGDLIPKFKAKNQRNEIILSSNYYGKKLVFLSDECGTCVEVLKRMSLYTNLNDFLVIKSISFGDSLSDIEYPISIIRSKKIIKLFGVVKVPTIMTVNDAGRVSGIDELTHMDNLVSLLRFS